MQYSIASLTAAIGMVAAAAVDLNQASSPMSVSLIPMGNHMVKATITNTDSKAYNIFTRGSILDTKAPTKKVHVSNKKAKAAFKGISIKTATKNLTQDSFTPFAAGESKEIMINMAEIYDLSESSIYDILGHGRFRYAEAGSTELVKDSMDYNSNALSMHIDGSIAAKAMEDLKSIRLSKRSDISSDCSASDASTVKKALSLCVSQATAAADAALNGSSDKFYEYFKSTATKDRQYVHDRYTAIAKECRSSPGGIITIHCKDVDSFCSSNDFAYHDEDTQIIVWCQQYYNAPLESSQCHADDKVGTLIHETSHDGTVYSPGTDDNAYGYSDCSKLPRSQALNNADTFEYYANAIYVGC